MHSILFHLELDMYYYDCTCFETKLRLLFEISNILSLGWDNSRTHLSEKEKMKKCR